MLKERSLSLLCSNNTKILSLMADTFESVTFPVFIFLETHKILSKLAEVLALVVKKYQQGRFIFVFIEKEEAHMGNGRWEKPIPKVGSRYEVMLYIIC